MRNTDNVVFFHDEGEPMTAFREPGCRPERRSIDKTNTLPVARAAQQAMFKPMNDKNTLAEDRTDWAEDRTDWAEDRTILANERTFAGWMRTGMAAIGVALGLKAVFGDFEPTWLAKAGATLFIVVAILIFWAARQSSCRTQNWMNDHAVERQSATRTTIIATILSIGAVLTGTILWYL